MANYGKLVLLLSLLFLPFYAVRAEISPSIQINTHFNKVKGAPSWLIIIHDVDSSAVYPYLFDLTSNDNYFTIFTNARNYRIVSILQFDFEHKKITNFCHFPQGQISNDSMTINLTGSLTSNPATSQCMIYKFKMAP